MNYEIQNLTRRLVSVHCNSGKTCHLPPGETYEVPEQEIAGNQSVKKLLERKLIKASQVSQTSSGKSAPQKKRATESGVKKASVTKSSKRKPSRSKN